MTNAISAETFFTIALMLTAYTLVVRTAVHVIVRIAYNDTHPQHFTSFLDTSTILAAVGVGMCFCFGALLG